MKKNSSRSKKNDEVTRRFHFNHVSTITNGAVATGLDLNTLEAFAEDFAELSDMYRYFRVDKFEVTSWVDLATGNGNELLYALYYAPNGTTTSPQIGLEGTYAMGHAWSSDATSGTCAGHNARLVLHKQDLHTITPWFVTLNDASAGADADGLGVIIFVQGTSMTNSGSICFEVDMTITFRMILDPETISAAAEKRVLSRIESEARAKLGKLGEPACQQNPPPAAAPARRR